MRLRRRLAAIAEDSAAVEADIVWPDSDIMTLREGGIHRIDASVAGGLREE